MTVSRKQNSPITFPARASCPLELPTIEGSEIVKQNWVSSCLFEVRRIENQAKLKFTFNNLSIDIVDQILSIFLGIPFCLDSSNIPIFEGSLGNITGKLHSVEFFTPLGVKIGWTVGIWLPWRIYCIPTVVDLVHWASAVLMHFNIIYIPPWSASIAASVEFNWNGLRAT